MATDELSKLLVAIVDHGKGSHLAEVYQDLGLPIIYQCIGHGTANSRILDYLSLSETRKDVMFTFVPTSRVREVMAEVGEALNLNHPGRGILFTVTLSGVSSRIHKALNLDGASNTEEDTVKSVQKHDLIIVVVEHGYQDAVMDAACEYGAHGGTVIRGRSFGKDLGLSADPEQDIVALVVPHEQKLDIMRAVNRGAGSATRAHGILFSLPVEDAIGLHVDPESESSDDSHIDDKVE